jgi:hypothetical protein
VEVLTQCALTIRQFDMCHLFVRDESLKGFVERNKKSLRSVSFHNVTTSQMEQSGIRFYRLSLDMLCFMLNVVAHSAPCEAADCEGCLASRADGWRLVLNLDHTAGHPTIVEPSLDVSSGSECGMPVNSR